MIPLLRLPARSVYYLPHTAPAVFYLADVDAGGVLINVPGFSARRMAEVTRIAPLRYAFIPSRFGARHAGAWREAGARVIGSREDLAHGRVAVDVALDRSWRFTRALDFLPLSGRTSGTWALRCKTKPAIIFFGPALSRTPSGWPGVVAQPDDHSYENRLLGAVGLRALKYEYAFTDDFDPVKSRYGPGASRGIGRELERALQPG
ncbi:MAG TPA: hypothetical protein VD839_00535 [Burkholderiales bacterium]|nr:hypothetical protein [Burkholderiales bacterium]